MASPRLHYVYKRRDRWERQQELAGFSVGRVRNEMLTLARPAARSGLILARVSAKIEKDTLHFLVVCPKSAKYFETMILPVVADAAESDVSSHRVRGCRYLPRSPVSQPEQF
jgi:hypothetical protein